MPDPLVQVQQLCKTYRRRGRGAEVLAVDDVTFDVAEGSSLAIVGESGSGKTTVAKMLLGLEEPSGGFIIINGKARTLGRVGARERRRRAREIQLVFQDPYTSLDPRQRVGACIEEVLRLHFADESAGRRKDVTLLLEQVGLRAEHADALPRALSGGQRQRVAIARALASRPQILVLDEPVSALDVSIQGQILNLLREIRRETRISYIFISHDLGVVRHVSDRAIVMHHGRVVEQGPTERILDEPEHPYTRLLRASVPGPGWDPHAITSTGLSSARPAS